MSLINSSSAVITKARSKYGRRLTNKDYKALSKCQSVDAVVNYLKNQTHYSQTLNKLQQDNVHRGQIETMLRQKLFYDFDSLCRYEMSDGSPFSEFIIRQYEISQLVHFMLLLNCSKVEEYIYALPSYFNKHTDIDLVKLSRCRSFDEFLNTLNKGEYHKILEKFRPTSDKGIDIASAEDALRIYAQTELYTAISKRKSKKERQMLIELFDYINDFNNLSRILRLKKYYSLSAKQIKEHLIPFGTLRKDAIDKMCNANDIDDVFNIMITTPAGKRLHNMSIEKEEHLAIEGRYNMCRKKLYFSQSPAVVLLSYMYVSETELQNIITIIEGVRYNCSAEHILGLLIYN